MEGGEALLIVDMQLDFCEGGALAVRGADEIVPVLNRYIRLFSRYGAPIGASRDWHPEETVHFKECGGRWPRHCVRNTRGAAFHPGLRLPDGVLIITKGTGANDDDYSAFQGRGYGGEGLREMLQARGVKKLFVGGVATDYCVKNSAMDGAAAGFDVYILVDAIGGVDLVPGDSERAIAEMKSRGVKAISFCDVVVLLSAAHHRQDGGVNAKKAERG